MATGYLSLGSNIGDREGNITAAIRLLELSAVAIEKRSSNYETDPFGPVQDQPDFLNVCVEIKTECNPEELLTVSQQIEQELGRVKSVRFGPRLIDIDILLFGDAVVDNERLRIPHERLLQRRFVLEPLVEIAPQLELLGEPIAVHINRLPVKPAVRKL